MICSSTRHDDLTMRTTPSSKVSCCRKAERVFDRSFQPPITRCQELPTASSTFGSELETSCLLRRFYQHIVNGCEWDFGIVWGHAVSTDLVHWEHLAPALVPTPGGLDADGCFSGCCLSDGKSPPVILYTGVRLRSNAACGPLPPPEYDLNLPFIESQLWAVPDTGVCCMLHLSLHGISNLGMAPQCLCC